MGTAHKLGYPMTFDIGKGMVPRRGKLVYIMHSVRARITVQVAGRLGVSTGITVRVGVRNR